VLAAQFAWVKPTNFAGYDEWLILSQVDRGIVDVPYAGRPLGLLPSLPERLLPSSLWSWFALHAAYLAGEGALVFLLCLRLLPARPLVAFLAGVFASTWAPLDQQRLNVIQPYAGYAFLSCAALVLLVESWRRSHAVLIATAALLAFVDVRAYEASVALLLGAPVLLLWSKTRPARAWTWVAAWETVVALALALAALPLLLPGRDTAYQQLMMGGIDLHPLRLLARFGAQYRYHLEALVRTSPAQLGIAPVAAAVAVYALAFWLLARRAPAPVLPARRELAAVALLGLVLAGLGYAVLVMSPRFFLASRAQFLSAPGIALFLAAGFALLASFAPERLRAAFLGVLGAWVVAVGAERTLFLQRHWDGVTVYAEQVRLLRGLVALAPRFKPNTLVLLLDEADVFKATFPFRHALTLLYAGEATGHALGKWDFGYPIRVTPAGIASEPYPSLRGAEAVTFHRYDEIVLVHQPKQGELRLLEDWPAGVLPPLPPDARYAPLARITQGPAPPGRWVLRDPSLP